MKFPDSVTRSSDRVRIAYVMTPIDFGGAEKVSLTFLRNIDRTKFEVHVAAFVRPWEKSNLLADTLCEIGFKVFRVPVARQPRGQGTDYLRLPRCCVLMHEFLRKGAFDLLHTHGYLADIVAGLSAKFLRTPHLATCHGFIPHGNALIFYNKLDRLVLRFSDRIIAVSGEIRSDLIKRGIKKEKITVIRNAVEAVGQESLENIRNKNRRVLGIKDDEFTVGYVGRLSKEKGVRYLIEAVRLLQGKGIKVRAVIIGDGPERYVLEKLTTSNGLADQVFLLGFENEPEKWFPTMDAFVLPSLTEGTPMALLEAMSCGLPVIATKVGGVPEIVKTMQNGILVFAGQPLDIALSVLRLQKDPALRRMLGTEGRRTVETKYNSKAWTKNIEQEYFNLVHLRS